MSTEPLKDEEIEQALKDLGGWSRQDDALVKTFQFTDFRAALAFMVRAGLEAEAANHHPSWTNVYNRVDVRLSTHDADNRITKKDVALAKAMARIPA
jgi:4a-hydroxytetrahydrobiopterin dehydratase